MTSRRTFIKQSLTGLAAATLIPDTLLAASKTVKLTILHTNDMHSRIEPFPEDGRTHSGLGGMARRAAVIKQIRKEEEHVLVFDAGDIFQGTPYFNYFGGELEFKLMSQMGYDAATIGNHDFDNGMNGLLKMLPEAHFPFLIANYDFSRTILKDSFVPYKIIPKAGLNIGVFGLGIELAGLVQERLYEQTAYNDPISVAKEMVQELKNQKCDMIICLSHLGYAYENNKVSDQVLARSVDGIDLILGGHTHTFLEEPTKLLSPEGKPVYINQVGWAGIRLGRMDFVFSKGGKKQLTDAVSMVISNESGKN